MNRKTIITALLALVAMAGQAQEARIDTVVPKFLINGYFFREMPKLPDATPSMTPLKDKEGNRIIAIGLNVDLPKSVIRQAIPREQVHNADQFLDEQSTIIIVPRSNTSYFAVQFFSLMIWGGVTGL